MRVREGYTEHGAAVAVEVENTVAAGALGDKRT